MIRWNAQSDAELLAATPTDKGAFAAFYRRHVSTVVAFVMSRTGRPELAADIAAEVFAAVLQTPESYEESRGAARSWLFSMASSRLVDAIRRGAVEDRARVRLGMPVLQVSDADLERIEQLAGSAGATCEQLLAGLTVVVAVERDLSVAVGQSRAERREVGGRDLARPCGGSSFLCVHMRSRSGWRAIAMNKGSIEGVRGTRIERC